MLKKIVTAGLVAVTLALPRAALADTWIAYTFGPSKELPNVHGFENVTSAMEKADGGDPSFRVRLEGSLPINPTNITQAVGEGTIKFADDGFFLGNVPIAGVLRLPMLLQSPQDYETAFNIMQPYITKAFAAQGVVVLGHFLFPHQVIFSTKKLEAIDDIKGQKLRVSSPEQAAFVEKFGGVPVTMSGSEVAPALQRGTIDGALTASAGGGKIWGDMLKYNYRLPISYFDAFYIANKAAWDGLSVDKQKALRDAITAEAPNTTKGIFSVEDSVTADLATKGVTITTPTADQITEATETIEPYWNQWAKERGPEAVEALAKVRAALGR